MNERYNLERFVIMQKTCYESALFEIRRGIKYTHWMWYVFPQLRGLGHSENAWVYGIEGIDEARAYFAHPELREHLLEITGALLELDTNNAYAVFGSPDDLKLRSCMTLFAQAAPECDLFVRVLGKFFGGEPDWRTLEMLREE